MNLSANADRLFAEAARRFAAGHAREAEPLLRQALAAAPDHVPSLSLLALIAGRTGRDSECVTLLERAIAHGDAEQATAAGLLLAAAHRRAGRLALAEAALRQAAKTSPRAVEPRLQLVQLLRELGRDAEALAFLRETVEIDPEAAAAHGLLARLLHDAGELDAAADHAARAVALAPGDPMLAGNLAVLRNAQGRFGEAASLCRAALESGEAPALLNTLGVALAALGDLAGAAAALEHALALQPAFADALYNLAAVRKDEGRTDDAVALLRRVTLLAPDLAPARLALCMAHLPPLYRDTTEIDRRRADYSAELEALIALAAARGPAALASGVGAAQPFQLAYQGRIDVGLQRRYGALVCEAMAAAYPVAPLAAEPRPGERLRVGIVCGYLRDHSVWRAPTRGWVSGLDRNRFELIGFHTGGLRDAETDRAAALFDRFVQGALPLARWLNEIAAVQPHALIYPEIGMDGVAAQLAALRLAPAQYASWGHPSTTGYPTIDFYLSSDEMEPPDGAAHYSEQLVRLPGLSTAFELPRLTAPVPTRAALGLPEDAVIYWCCQSLYKYLPQDDDVFAEIAARTPASHFVFFAFPGSPPLTQRFEDRLAAGFAARGLDARRFCTVLPRMSAPAFLAAMGCADVMLDSIGWSGCNSVLDALARALPVVTLPGDTMRSRHAAAMLREIGLERCVCATKADYIELAAAFGADESLRAALSASVRRGTARLERQDAAIATLEAHLAMAVGGATAGVSPSA